MNGFLVYCGTDTDGKYFAEAAAAMRYAAFMAELGYDALYFNAQMIQGKVIREERVSEQFMRSCVVLGL